MVAVGDRIRHQRTQLGLEVETVSQLSQVTVPRLVAIEAGNTPPTVWELSSVAAALAVDPNALRRGDPDADARRSSARFRAPLGIGQLGTSDMRLLARVAEASRIHHFLWQQCKGRRGRVEANRSVRAIDDEPAVWEQGYKLGKLAREALAPQQAPIRSVQEVLERGGVLVVFASFETDSIEGASLYERDASPTIVLNRHAKRVGQPLSRRAVLAHELCHLLHDSAKQDDLLTVVSRPADRSPMEKRANAFAPSFLAPKSWVDCDRNKPAHVRAQEVANTWGLSYEGAVWHAKNLKLISSKAADELTQTTGGIDATGFEPDLPRESPDQVGLECEVSELARSALGDLAIWAADKDVISVGRAAEILTFA